VEAALVELPQAKQLRFIKDYGMSERQANFLCQEKETADFFEQSVKLGADPATAALWMASDVQKQLNRSGVKLTESPLDPERFAELLKLLCGKKIHGRIAKQVLEVVFAENKAPRKIINERGWEQITDRKKLQPVVCEALKKNPDSVKQIHAGNSKPMGFLIGEIMKNTSGRAEPGLVRELLKEELNLSFIQVLSMGGAITGRRTTSGDILPGELDLVIQKITEDASLPGNIRFEEVEISKILSEEITPEDWSALILSVSDHLKENSSGIVIAHGTDTLAYTASLLFWLFPEPALPVVLTASLEPEESAEALKNAIIAVSEKAPGIYIVLNNRTLSPLNMKFEKVEREGFRNWNLPKPVFNSGFLSIPYSSLPEKDELTKRLEQAISLICIMKVYPGMKGDYLIALMNAGIRYFILELYDTGTANLRESPYSLRKAVLEGKERGVRFFCTSQQEGVVDFSSYITSHELWREGAVPMGSLTTESAFTRLLTVLLFTEGDEEVLQLMEQANEDITVRS
jgi:aspartyl-tRNA(Asn)/glutamyl-tRNA(Gln) amidotransferase subunit B